MLLLPCTLAGPYSHARWNPSGVPPKTRLRNMLLLGLFHEHCCQPLILERMFTSIKPLGTNFHGPSSNFALHRDGRSSTVFMQATSALLRLGLCHAAVAEVHKDTEG